MVNLPARADRRVEVEAELGRYGLSLSHAQVTLFAAIRPEDQGAFPNIGTRGCFMSHLAILEAIAAGDEPAGLILEDDADFTPALAEGMIAAAATEWDLIYGYPGGAEHGDAQGMVALTPKTDVLTTHFIAVKRGTAALIVPYFRAMLERPLGDPDGGPMHVDGAYNWFRRAHPQMRAFSLLPEVARQRPSKTDIHTTSWFDRVAALAPALVIVRRIKRRLRG